MSISLDYLIGNQITALMWRCYLSKFAHLQHSEFIMDRLSFNHHIPVVSLSLSLCLVCRQPAVLFVYLQLVGCIECVWPTVFLWNIFQWFLITFGFMVRPVSVPRSICSSEIWLGLGFKSGRKHGTLINQGMQVQPLFSEKSIQWQLFTWGTFQKSEVASSP